MKIPLAKKLFLSLAILIVIILCICITILYPTIKTITSLGSDINKIQQNLEEKYEISQKLRRSLQEIDNVQKNTIQYSQAYIKKGSELEIITALENIATENNITQNMDMTLVNTDNKDKIAMPEYYRISFITTGHFADQISYLDALNKLPYYIIIQNLNLEKRNKKENENNPLTLNFEARIYVENK